MATPISTATTKLTWSSRDCQASSGRVVCLCSISSKDQDYKSSTDLVRKVTALTTTDSAQDSKILMLPILATSDLSNGVIPVVLFTKCSEKTKLWNCKLHEGRFNDWGNCIFVKLMVIMVTFSSRKFKLWYHIQNILYLTWIVKRKKKSAAVFKQIYFKFFWGIFGKILSQSFLHI